MNVGNVNLVELLLNWFPMLLIFGVWVVFLRKMQGGQYANQQKKHLEVQMRQADALERIAAALEKRV